MQVNFVKSSKLQDLDFSFFAVMLTLSLKIIIKVLVLMRNLGYICSFDIIITAIGISKGSFAH